MTTSAVALITVVHGRRRHLARQLEMLSRSRHPIDRHVVVAIDDPALATWVGEDRAVDVVEIGPGRHGLPLAAARNVGAAVALDRAADLLIFLDVDCLPDPDLVGSYVDAAADPAYADSLLCGPVAYLPPPGREGYDLERLRDHPPHSARPAPNPDVRVPGGDPRLFWSLSFATTAATWARVGGFCENYQGYGAEDTDFGFAARAAGVDLTWVGGATAYHQWHPSQNPPQHHLDHILRNAAIFAERWDHWPMEGWLAAFRERGLIRWDEASSRYVRVRPTAELAS